MDAVTFERHIVAVEIECRMFTLMTKTRLQQIELDTTISQDQEAADQCQPVDVIPVGTFLTVLQGSGTMIQVDRPAMRPSGSTRPNSHNSVSW